MTINEICQLIITGGAVVGGLLAIVGILGKVFGWFHKQNSQDGRIAELRIHHDEDIKGIKNEMTLIMYGVLASLKGLKEQGCNGPVTEAIEKIDKYLNQKAHE